MPFLVIKIIFITVFCEKLHGKIITDGFTNTLRDPLQPNEINITNAGILDKNSLLNQTDAFNSSEEMDTLNMIYMFGYDNKLTNNTNDHYDTDKDRFLYLSNNNLFSERSKIINDAWNDVINIKNRMKYIDNRFNFGLDIKKESRLDQYQNLINHKMNHLRPFSFVLIEKRKVLNHSPAGDEVKNNATRSSKKQVNYRMPLEIEREAINPWEVTRKKRTTYTHHPHHFRLGHKKKTLRKSTPSHRNCTIYN